MRSYEEIDKQGHPRQILFGGLACLLAGCAGLPESLENEFRINLRLRHVPDFLPISAPCLSASCTGSGIFEFLLQETGKLAEVILQVHGVGYATAPRGRRPTE